MLSGRNKGMWPETSDNFCLLWWMIMAATGRCSTGNVGCSTHRTSDVGFRISDFKGTTATQEERTFLYEELHA